MLSSNQLISAPDSLIVFVIFIRTSSLFHSRGISGYYLFAAAERWRSPAAGSGSEADAGGSQVQRFVRPSFGKGQRFSPGPSPNCASDGLGSRGGACPALRRSIVWCI